MKDDDVLSCDHVRDGEMLERYLAGELDEAAGDRVETHYFACAACFERLQILRAVREEFPPERRWNRPALAAVAAGLMIAAAGAAGISTLRRENRDLQQRLARIVAVPAQPDPHAQEIAALRDRLAALSAPEINARIVDLEPEPQVRRGEAVATTIDVPGDVARVTFVLTAGSDLGSPPYSVAVLGADGRALWQAAGLRKSPFETFTLTVPVSILPAGPATIRVQSANGRGGTQDYRFRIVRR